MSVHTQVSQLLDVYYLFTHMFITSTRQLLADPLAARSEAYVCSRSPAEVVGSNSTGGMDVCLF
jgi:hypothetical protein